MQEPTFAGGKTISIQIEGQEPVVIDRLEDFRRWVETRSCCPSSYRDELLAWALAEIRDLRDELERRSE